MKRYFLILAALLLTIGCTPRPLMADDTPLINHFEISLYSPSQKKLIPVIVSDNGKFSVNRRARLTRGSILHIKLTTTIPDKWISIAFMDTYGNLYDLPLDQRKMTRTTKETIFRMPGRFPPGDVDVNLCLWSEFDEVQNANEGAMYMTNFMRVGEYSY